ILNYKLLHARSDFQELAMSPVFVEFPQKIRDWHYELDDFREQIRNALTEKLESNEHRLENLTNRLSPLKLAAKLNEKKIRLALLQQKQNFRFNSTFCQPNFHLIIRFNFARVA